MFVCIKVQRIIKDLYLLILNQLCGEIFPCCQSASAATLNTRDLQLRTICCIAGRVALPSLCDIRGETHLGVLMEDCCQSADNFVTASKTDNCVHMCIYRELQLVGICSGREKAFEQGRKLKSRFILPSERVRLKLVLATCRRDCFLPALHTTVLPLAETTASLAARSLRSSEVCSSALGDCCLGYSSPVSQS